MSQIAAKREAAAHGSDRGPPQAWRWTASQAVSSQILGQECGDQDPDKLPLQVEGSHTLVQGCEGLYPEMGPHRFVLQTQARGRSRCWRWTPGRKKKSFVVVVSLLAFHTHHGIKFLIQVPLVTKRVVPPLGVCILHPNILHLSAKDVSSNQIAFVLVERPLEYCCAFCTRCFELGCMRLSL